MLLLRLLMPLCCCRRRRFCCCCRCRCCVAAARKGQTQGQFIGLGLTKARQAGRRGECENQSENIEIHSATPSIRRQSTCKCITCMHVCMCVCLCQCMCVHNNCCCDYTIEATLCLVKAHVIAPPKFVLPEESLTFEWRRQR